MDELNIKCLQILRAMIHNQERLMPEDWATRTSEPKIAKYYFILFCRFYISIFRCTFYSQVKYVLETGKKDFFIRCDIKFVLFTQVKLNLLCAKQVILLILCFTSEYWRPLTKFRTTTTLNKLWWRSSHTWLHEMRMWPKKSSASFVWCCSTPIILFK